MFKLQLNNLDFITFLTTFATLFRPFKGSVDSDVSFLHRKRHFFSSPLVSSERLFFVGGVNRLESRVPVWLSAGGCLSSDILRVGFRRDGLERDVRMVRASMSSTSVSTRWTEICDR